MYAGTHEISTRKRRVRKTKPTQQAAIKLAKRFVAEIQKNGLSIRHAFLFGSFATGKQHEWSDIDLALVSDEFGSNRFFDNRLIQDIKTQKPFFGIETHTFNTADFEKGDCGFIDQEIKAKGILIL